MMLGAPCFNEYSARDIVAGDSTRFVHFPRVRLRHRERRRGPGHGDIGVLHIGVTINSALRKGGSSTRPRRGELGRAKQRPVRKSGTAPRRALTMSALLLEDSIFL